MFNLQVILCLISVNFFKHEKYVLSTKDSIIEFPKIDITNVDDIQNIINNYVGQIFVNPKVDEIYRTTFIAFNHKDIKSIYKNSNNTIHILYGGTMSNMETVSNYTWMPFDYMDANIKKELSLINLTLQHVI